MCIGNRFALLETKVLLFHFLARYNLKPCSKSTDTNKQEDSIYVGRKRTLARNRTKEVIDPNRNPTRLKPKPKPVKVVLTIIYYERLMP